MGPSSNPNDSKMPLCNTPIAVDSKYFFVKKLSKTLLTQILLMVTVLFIP